MFFRVVKYLKLTVLQQNYEKILIIKDHVFDLDFDVIYPESKFLILPEIVKFAETPSGTSQDQVPRFIENHLLHLVGVHLYGLLPILRDVVAGNFSHPLHTPRNCLLAYFGDGHYQSWECLYVVDLLYFFESFEAHDGQQLGVLRDVEVLLPQPKIVNSVQKLELIQVPSQVLVPNVQLLILREEHHENDVALVIQLRLLNCILESLLTLFLLSGKMIDCQPVSFEEYNVFAWFTHVLLG